MTMDNQPWIYVAHCATATLRPENNPELGEHTRRPVRERTNVPGAVILGSRRPPAIGYLRKDVSGSTPTAALSSDRQLRSLL